MSDPAHGVVVAHGVLAAALVGEAERISGERGVLAAVSNSECGPEDIERRLADAVGAGPAVIFVDMPCGSCFFAAMKTARNRSDIRVVTGVNLPMLLDFVSHRTLPPADGAARAAGKGSDAIRQV
ncbi:MAG: PTS mannose transporter subunit IID [Gemmatimonadota bacterium]